MAAAEEERFSRVKHDPRLPVRGLPLLPAGGRASASRDLDCVAYYESPVKKLARQLWAGPEGARRACRGSIRGGPSGRSARGSAARAALDIFEHHASHAASAFYCSGFAEAAVLTVDGVGEWATTTYGRGRRRPSSTLFEEVEFPHSLGPALQRHHLLSRLRGQRRRVQGDGPRALRRAAPSRRRCARWSRDGPGGSIPARPRLLRFRRAAGGCTRRARWPSCSARRRAAPRRRSRAFHQDVARSLQARARRDPARQGRASSTDACPRANLCMAGGVALNCVANGRILREGPFERLFVQPAAGDAGGCLGAAALAHAQLDRASGRPAGARARLPRARARAAARSPSCSPPPGSPAARLPRPRGRAAGGGRRPPGARARWSAGSTAGMEFGPRALGARSILADPRDPDMRDRLNRLVKKREAFRPFAPSVLAGARRRALRPRPPVAVHAGDLPVFARRSALPAITHVDGSARPQTVDPGSRAPLRRPARGLRRRTGCPLLVNTSFNVRGEPIVDSPVDALSAWPGPGSTPWCSRIS